MGTSDEQISYLDNILQKLQGDEQYMDRLYRFIQDGFIKCLREVPETKGEQIEEINVSDDIISEIENVLAKAQIAYKKSKNSQESNHSSRKVKRNNQMSTNSENVSLVRSSRTTKSKYQNPIPLPKTVSIQSISTVTVNSSRQGRLHSEAAVLRKRAKSWLPPKESEHFQVSTTDSSNSHNISRQTKLLACTYNPNSIGLELNETVLQRIKDVIALSRSMETYAEEALICSKDSTTEKDFLNFCENLVNRDYVCVESFRQFFSHNLPKLIFLFDQFTRIYEVIDWDIATSRQHQWRHSMLENFSALFNIAESFKPILIERSEACDAMCHSTILGDAFPSLETLWAAYVCTGRELPSSYTDPPIEIPSRGCRLTIGPAILPNSPNSRRDFEEMSDLWVEIFYLQRKLQILDFVENQMPHWLRSIGNQPNEKASTLRLLCQIACDCYPVTVANT